MLLEDIATYLATTLGLTLGVNVFYEALPPTPDLVVVVREPKEGGYVYPQLGCDIRKVQIIVRDKSGSDAYTKANNCHKALVYQGGDTTKAPDGLIAFTGTSFGRVELQGNPRYDDVDDKGRRLYKFNATILTEKEY